MYIDLQSSATKSTWVTRAPARCSLTSATSPTRIRPLVPLGPGGSNYDFYPANAGQYDVLGRVFRAGVRFKM